MRTLFTFLCAVLLGSMMLHAQSSREASLKKPDSIRFFRNPGQSMLDLKTRIDSKKLEEFYQASEKAYANSYPRPENEASVNNSFWQYYLVASAPLFAPNDYDENTPCSFHDNIDLKHKGKVFFELIKVGRNDLGKLAQIPSLKRQELAELIALYSARIPGDVRKEYDPDLEVKLKKIEEAHSIQAKEQVKKLPKGEYPDLGKEHAKSINFNNKIASNDSRNMRIKIAIESMESDLVPTLIKLFPGKAHEVRKYIAMAGYTEDEADELIDRTAGRTDSNEFLYQGTKGKKHDRKTALPKK